MTTAEGPIFVNAKQYRDFIRCRQSYAKAKMENKVLKLSKCLSSISNDGHGIVMASELISWQLGRLCVRVAGTTYIPSMDLRFFIKSHHKPSQNLSPSHSSPPKLEVSETTHHTDTPLALSPIQARIVSTVKDKPGNDSCAVVSPESQSDKTSTESGNDSRVQEPKSVIKDLEEIRAETIYHVQKHQIVQQPRLSMGKKPEGVESTM
ncbi:Nuclear transcription factor Y subunit A [Forsythia ovata]|uniref:Nuclear transcription factor Y subunit A n=1 Tax=Forsythia ovata TaxID=205694 RepID=A0ABD1W935_9LAMI